MTSLVLAAALLCEIPLTVGTHALVCEAHYLHTDSTGQRYYDIVERGHVVTSPGFGETARCEGEGYPELVVLRDNGSLQCVAGECVLCDGFESGDTENWSRP